VQFGGKAVDAKSWGNKRIEMWAGMRQWLPGACIDDDQDLRTDLTAPEYHHHGRTDALVLESKEDMAKRGLASTDDGDALALTFANPVATTIQKAIGSARSKATKDYNPLVDRLRRARSR
jgi:hypothetical protein